MSFLGKSWSDWHCLIFGHWIPLGGEYQRHASSRRRYAARDVSCKQCGRMFGQHERTR